MNALRKSSRGLTLVELAVALAIVALLMTAASPWFGSTVRANQERNVPEKFLQDFSWARGAAGVANAAALNTGLTGPPTVTLSIATDCSWTLQVNGSTDASHSMTTAQLSAKGISMSCTGAPLALTFDTQGGTGTSGSLSFVGSTRTWPLQILASGSVVRTRTAS